MTDNDIIIHIIAPKKQMKAALSVARNRLERCPTKDHLYYRPKKGKWFGNPFFVEVEGNYISVEYIPEEDIDGLNASLTLIGVENSCET